MDSILTSVKKMLGIAEDCRDFDADIIMHINTVFMILNQLGVGPSTYFTIEDDIPTWSDFIPDGQNLEMVKSYMYMKVRLLFDPSASSTVMQSMNQAISEMEWRLNVSVDPGTK